MVRETIDAFIAARLLTTNEIAGTTTIEVSHEAVIREWVRLSTWLREAREDIPLQQTISEDVAAWERHGKRRDRLYRGSQLKEARAWATRNTPSSNEAAFLRTSTTYQVGYRVSVTAIFLLLVSIIGWQAQPLLLSGVVGLIYGGILPSITKVTSPNDDGPGSLRQIIANANPGSTITFDPSLIGKTITLTTGGLTIASDLTIRGPGAGLLTINGHNDNNAKYNIHVVKGVTVTIEGLTITRFNSSGIKNDGRLTLINSVVSQNTTDGDGGGIENNVTGTLTLIGSSVLDNVAESDILPYISNLVFEDGGGIYNHGTLTLSNSIVSGNTATKYGGGIVNGRGAATALITNTTITDNTACQGGGGIVNGAHDGMVTLTLINSTVSRNTSGRCLRLSSASPKDQAFGGGIYNTFLALKFTVINSTIADNTALNGPGGGIFASSIMNGKSILTMTNSTIGDNTTSSSGGGIAFSGSQATITFCTIYANAATQNGGGIFVEDTTAPGISRNGEMSRSLVAGNQASRGPDIAGAFTTVGYNLIQNFSSVVFVDPLNKNHSSDIDGNKFPSLGIDSVLRDNGGQGQRHTFTFSLLAGSPAIDAIPLDACLAGSITTDQRGVKRPQGPGCDIGAYEYVPSH